jgi:hypothetical protein
MSYAKISNDTRVSIFSTVIPSQSNKAGARNKIDSNRKERNQTTPICKGSDLRP